MKPDVCIVSADRIYAQWIKLELIEKNKSVALSESLAFAPSAELYIIDIDTVSFASKGDARTVCFGFSEKPPVEKAVPYLVRPFTAKELLEACEQARSISSDTASFDADILSSQRKSIIYNGEEYRLTEKEYMLYELLREADGESVDRLTICNKLWGALDNNSLNLYVHYLRQKLERNGTKAIRSHRGKGYSLIIRKEGN